MQTDAKVKEEARQRTVLKNNELFITVSSSKYLIVPTCLLDNLFRLATVATDYRNETEN